MANQIKTLPWRNRLQQITPDDHRLGDDLLLIDNGHLRGASYTEPFRCDATTIIIYLRGGVKGSIDMAPIQIDAPCALMLQRGRILQVNELSDDLSTLSVVMSDRFTEALRHQVPRNLYYNQLFYLNPTIPLDKDTLHTVTEFYGTLTRIVSNSQSPYALNAAQHLILTLFYARFAASQETPALPRISHAGRICERFLLLVRGEFMSHRDVSYYASRLCITPKYLARVVARVARRTPAQIIDHFVIVECKALLLGTDLSIGEIACRMNFLSVALFGKYFKRLTGQSPTAYRRQEL